MQRQSYLILAKTFGLAGIVATLSDIAQPLAPIATYVMGASAVSLTILLLAKIIIQVWNEKMAISTCFSSVLFVLSGFLYMFQSASADAAANGVLASEISGVGELQKLLGVVSERLESIDSRVAHIDNTISSFDEHVKSIDASAMRMNDELAGVTEQLAEVKKETSDDPRKELANIGMRWEYDNFLDALSNEDERAIKLYLQGGMKLRKDGFEEFVTRIYSKSVMEILTQGEAFEADFDCPKRVSFYRRVAGDRDKADFVSDTCGAQIGQLIKEFDRLIGAQEESIASDKAHNERLEQERGQCIHNLSAIPVAHYVEEVGNYNYEGEPSVKKTVVTRLKGNGKVLKVLAYKNVQPTVREDKLREYYKDIAPDLEKLIDEACIAAHPDANKKVIDAGKLEQLKDEKRLLSEGYGFTNKAG